MSPSLITGIRNDATARVGRFLGNGATLVAEHRATARTARLVNYLASGLAGVGFEPALRVGA